MRVVSHSCERVGYFSQVEGVDKNVTPVFRRLHVEELKKINGVGGAEKIPFDCNKYVEDVGGIAAAKPLEDFLIQKGVIDQKTHEFNVICRSSVLTMIYMGQAKGKDFSVRHDGQNIIIEECKGHYSTRNARPQPSNDVRASSGTWNKNYENKSKWTANSGRTCKDPRSSNPWNQPRMQSINAGCYADVHLTMLPIEDVDQEKIFGESNLYIVVKHRYRYHDGTVVNLFVSKEIYAVEFDEEGEEMVSIDLKIGVARKFADVKSFVANSKKPQLMDFLAGGISYLHGITLGDNVVHKILVMDRLSSVCNKSFLDEFKEKLDYFLFTMATSTDRILYNRIEIQQRHVFLTSNDLALHAIELPGVLHGTGAPSKNECNYDPNAAHHLVIVGSCSEPFPLQNHLYHTDVVSIDNFCRRLFHSFMCEPQNIFVYGKKEEFQKVRQAMKNEELTIATFVEVK